MTVCNQGMMLRTLFFVILPILFLFTYHAVTVWSTGGQLDLAQVGEIFTHLIPELAVGCCHVVYESIHHQNQRHNHRYDEAWDSEPDEQWHDPVIAPVERQAEVRPARAAPKRYRSIRNLERRLVSDKSRPTRTGMKHISEDLRGNCECTWTELTLALVVVLAASLVARLNLRGKTATGKLVHV